MEREIRLAHEREEELKREKGIVNGGATDKEVSTDIPPSVSSRVSKKSPKKHVFFSKITIFAMASIWGQH